MSDNSQTRNLFPAYKVFIYGVDVTDDVFSVSVSSSVGHEINKASIILSNKGNQYLFTSDDLNTILQDPEVQKANIAYSTANNYSVLDNSSPVAQNTQLSLEALLKKQILANVLSPRKQKILLSKLSQRASQFVQPSDFLGGAANQSSSPWLFGWVLRYPLQAFDPIFHSNDPVRIFYRDPENPNVWYHKFCGFVADMDDHLDANLESTLSVTCESQSRLAYYARVQTNPTALDQKTQIIAGADAQVRSFYTAGFANLTLPEIIFTMFFGNNPDSVNGQGKFNLTQSDSKNTTVKRTVIGGIGNFNFSQSAVVRYGNADNDSLTFAGQYSVVSVPDKSLSTYQSLIDHQVLIDDLTEMLFEDATTDIVQNVQQTVASIQNSAVNNNNIIDIEKVIDYIGTNPDYYKVDGGRIILLIPGSLGVNNTEFLLRDITQNSSINAEFKSRLAIIKETVDRLNFMYYDSPKGDIIIEFPMYDFDPTDFDNSGTSTNVGAMSVATLATPQPIPNVIASTNSVGGQLLSSTDNAVPGSNLRGPFSPRYYATPSNTDWFSKSHSDERVRTQIATTYSLVPGYNIQQSNAIAQVPTVTLNNLVPLYGVRTETLDPKGLVKSPQAANMYAHIQLNKLNADAKNLQVALTPNFGLWLNRPFLLTQRDTMATILSITDTINWNQTVETVIDLAYARGWDGMVDPITKNKVYTPIGGFASRPLNYKFLLGSSTAQSSNATNAILDSQTNPNNQQAD